MRLNHKNFTMSFAQAGDIGIDYRDYQKVDCLPSGTLVTAIAGIWGDYVLAVGSADFALSIFVFPLLFLIVVKAISETNDVILALVFSFETAAGSSAGGLHSTNERF